MKDLNWSKMGLVVLHVFLGVVAALSPLLATVWGYVFFIYSFDRVIRHKNSDNWALLSAAYLLGLEILFRMASAYIFYEFSKYAISLLLITGMIVERNKLKLWKMPLMYFLLLVPSVVMVSGGISEIRSALSFNLSGPLALATTTIYCYSRRISKDQMMKMFLYILCALLSVVIIIIFRMPDLSKVGFNLSSNKGTSGGFGPNQVSTALGMGFLLVGVAWLIKGKITSVVLVDRAIGFLLLCYAVLTFARGGVITPVVALFFAVYIYSSSSGNIQQFFRVIQVLVVTIVIGSFLWLYLDNVTHNALGERYEKSLKKRTTAQPNSSGAEAVEGAEDLGTDFSGREFIVFADMKIFASYPILGVGPGMAPEYREKYIGVRIAAHTEMTRMLAEHGIYGAASALLMILMPFTYYFKFSKTPEQKTYLVAFVIFGLFTTMHAAMRLAVPGACYGLGFLILEPAKNALERKDG